MELFFLVFSLLFFTTNFAMDPIAKIRFEGEEKSREIPCISFDFGMRPEIKYWYQISAFIGDELAGHIEIGNRDKGLIVDLQVIKRLRKKGIGKALLKEAVSYAQKEGKVEIHGEMLKNNTLLPLEKYFVRLGAVLEENEAMIRISYKITPKKLI